MIRIILFLFIFSASGLWAQLPQFKDVSREAGLTVPHISTPDKQYIVESMSGGVGLIDCDNDGKLDIIVVNGNPLFDIVALSHVEVVVKDGVVYKGAPAAKPARTSSSAQ